MMYAQKHARMIAQVPIHKGKVASTIRVENVSFLPIRVIDKKAQHKHEK